MEAQLYSRTLSIFVLVPSPRGGSRGRVRIVVFPQKPAFWAGSGGCDNLNFGFHFVLNYSWSREGRSRRKKYKSIGFGAMDVTKPYTCIGFGAMAVTKPYKFIGFGAMAP